MAKNELENDVLEELSNLEGDVLEELSAWELEGFFIPMIDSMFEEGYTKTQVESFTMACVLCHGMAENTFYDICERYYLDPAENLEAFPENDKYWMKVMARKQRQSA